VIWPSGAPVALHNLEKTSSLGLALHNIITKEGDLQDVVFVFLNQDFSD
jgi:hypothetical protein